MPAISDDEGSNHSGSENESGDDLRPSNANEVFDSSEEEDEDDEDQLREEGKGWIVDEDDEDEEITRKKKRKHRKRKAEERKRKQKQQEEENDLLDEDDLDLLMENSGAKRPSPSGSSSKTQFKRLKRATAIEEDDEDHQHSATATSATSRSSNTDAPKSGGLQDFFSDDEDADEAGNHSDGPTHSNHTVSSRSSKNVSSHRSAIDELDDFIEEDDFSDMDDDQREQERERRKQERLQPTEITGIDSDRVNELYDIFGDGDDYAWALQMEEDDINVGGQGYDGEEGTRPQLHDIYEPEELKARMLTDGDKIIRDTDVPERFQEYRRNIKHYEIGNDEFEHEKQWVAYMLATEKQIEYQNGSDFSEAVAKVLTFIVKQNFEVPFIHAHRRDYLLKTTIIGEGDDMHTQVDTLLTENDLWRVVQLDIDFHSLTEKRKRVVDLQQTLKVDDDTLNHFIDNANSVTQFQDVNDYINFIYSEELKDINRKSSKTSIYEKVRNNKLFEMVRAIGIKAGDFAINVETSTKHQIPSDYDKDPLTLATEICSDEYSLFAKPQQAIEVAKHYFAEQLYNDMRMRKHLRDIAYSCTLSVKLTTQGKLKIDKNSPFADLKYSVNRDYLSLKAKPDFFLRMLKAEELGLIQIIFSYSHDDILHLLSPFILSEGQSDIAMKWNAFRTDALSQALKKLLPLVQLNFKEELRRDCETLLFTEVRSKFVGKLDQTPLEVKGFPKSYVPRVFAITAGNGKFGADAIIGCLLESSGKVVDTFKFIENPIRRVAMANESLFADHFLEVIAETRPDVIAINGFNAQTHKLYRIISELLTEHNVKVYPRDEDGNYYNESEANEKLEVVYINDEVASRYQHSQRAKEEFPDRSILARYTIALARFAQSPLLEYVNLKEDVISLSIHPHQNLLPEERLRDAIVTCFVDIVNMVGVDINQCVSNSYLAAMLPYVAGLGERKSSGLLKAVQQHPLFSRQALITNPSIRIGSVVFLNCSSFLRIPQHKSASLRSNDVIEALTPLDDTRIHPEDYALAEKMAGDALELDEEELEELKNSESGETVIDRLFAQPEYSKLLNALILEEYSRQLEQEFNKKKRATLQLILEELEDPFFDIRSSFRMMNTEEVFENLTGETPATLFNGAVIPIKIRSVGKYDVSGFTASQIFAKTEERKARESDDIRDLSAIYSIGQSVAAKVTNIDYQNFQINISLLKEDISNPVQALSFDKSENWDIQREFADLEEERSKQRQEETQTRTLQHAKFKNLNARDAETELSHREDGECVIRPSSKGPDHLAITWKVSQNLYQHVDVIEKTDPQYGNYFIIGKESYQDIDEVIHSYVGKMSKLIREMTTHEKFRTGSRDEVMTKLENFSRANPNKASYVFAWNHKRPGWFLLMFRLNGKEGTKAQCWNVKVEPNGYVLNQYNYPDMTRLCNGFKTLVMTKATTSRRPGPNNNAGGSTAQGNRSSYHQAYGGQQGYAAPNY